MISPVKVWRNQKKIQQYLGKQGKIVSFSMIRIAPSGFEGQAPYPVVVVQLDEGRRYVGQLVDWGKKHLCVGQRVEGVIRCIGSAHPEDVISYGIKFRPI